MIMSIVCSRVKSEETLNFHWISDEAAFLEQGKYLFHRLFEPLD